MAAAIIVEYAGEAAAEALFVSAAVGGVDVVGEAQQQLIVAGIILQGDFCHAPVGLTLEIDDVGVEHLEVALLAQIGDEALDAALVAHDLGAVGGLALLAVLEDGGVEFALVGQGDLDTGVQEALFPQALFQRFEVVDGGVLEHLRVGLEGDAGAGDTGVHGADALQRAVRVAAAEGLLVLVAVAADVDGQPLRAGVDDGRADAVQTAGHFIAGVLAAELAAGVQHSVDDGHSRDAQLGLDVHGDAASVVRDLNDIAGLDGHFNMGAVSGQCLVDGVIDDLVDQVMQAGRAGRTDIHAGALAHSLQTLEDLDLRTAVGMVGSRLAVGFGDDFFCHEMIASCCGWVSLYIPFSDVL